jgi:hypothetical protein
MLFLTSVSGIIGAGMMLTGYSKRRQFYKKYPPANKKGC